MLGWVAVLAAVGTAAEGHQLSLQSAGSRSLHQMGSGMVEGARGGGPGQRGGGGAVELLDRAGVDLEAAEGTETERGTGRGKAAGTGTGAGDTACSSSMSCPPPGWCDVAAEAGAQGGGGPLLVLGPGPGCCCVMQIKMRCVTQPNAWPGTGPAASCKPLAGPFIGLVSK